MSNERERRLESEKKMNVLSDSFEEYQNQCNIKQKSLEQKIEQLKTEKNQYTGHFERVRKQDQYELESKINMLIDLETKVEKLLNNKKYLTALVETQKQTLSSSDIQKECLKDQLDSLRIDISLKQQKIF